MELIYVLDRRRLQRELRRREAALREAAKAPQAAEPKPESLVAQPEAAEVPQPAEPKSESPAAQYASMTRRWWSCDFCGRDFHGYGQFLNHNCHEKDD
jgi:hypothetical protein